jgi:uncharacterized membrane protein
MQLAPVEYVIIEFPGNRFTGEIAPAIADLVARGLVRILDLVFVKKDADGAVTLFEFDELEEALEFAAIDGDADGLISVDDVQLLAAALAPESSALFVLWEGLWADELGRAVRAAGGELVAGGRIAHDVVAESLAGIGVGSNEEDAE